MTAQYQSFPGAAGDSRTLDKLKAMAFPEMSGRSFLDVGCNEGFFCGFAQFMGAARVVGIDHGAGFVRRARERFPGCEFLHRSWDALPKGRFDVILLASALHYADDQAALIARLVDKLAPGGVLVLELGIVSSPDAEWVTVKRGIDERQFPTMPLLRELLAGYAWKWMGPSVTQDGDPVKRHVLHISRRLPVVYLLMQPPGHGKTTIASGLFPSADVTLVTGDLLLGQVARGKRKAPPRLSELVQREHSPFTLDRLITAIYEAGLARELVRLVRTAAGDGDFALDMFVPDAYQAQIEEAFVAAGYLPVTLRWRKPGAPLLPRQTLDDCAEAFYLSMAGGGDAAVHVPAGFVDEIERVDGGLRLRGWAITADGRLPDWLQVRIGDETHRVERFEKMLRTDVQTHLGLPHALFGWRATVPFAGDAGTSPPRIEVAGAAADGAPTVYAYSSAVAAWTEAS